MMQRYMFQSAVCVLLATTASHVYGDETFPAPQANNPAPTFDAQRFYSAVRTIVRRHYPQATAHLLKNDVHFEFKTRLFVVHEAYKTGEWQDPWTERGPQKNGVHCDIEYRPGKYSGAAITPQTFDKRYFTVLLLTPYSEKLNAHLFVRLKLPGTGKIPPEFRTQLLQVINHFDRYTRP